MIMDAWELHSGGGAASPSHNARTVLGAHCFGRIPYSSQNVVCSDQIYATCNYYQPLFIENIRHFL